jgi:hypothetical protein
MGILADVRGLFQSKLHWDLVQSDDPPRSKPEKL